MKHPGLLSSAPDLPPFFRTIADRARLWDECVGLDQLGMAEEARRLLDRLPLDQPDLADFRALRIRLDAWDRRAEAAALRGMRLLQQDGPQLPLVVATATALLTAGRAKAAWTLLKALPEGSDAGVRGYAGACHASAAGDFEAACCLLAGTVRDADPNLPRALIDADLRPLWTHLANGVLSEDQVLVLAHPQMQAFLEATRSGPGIVGIDWQGRRMAPACARRWLLQEPASKLWFLSPTAPGRVKRRYRVWQQRLRGKHARSLERGIERARARILGRQVDGALTRAREGNYLAARWHLIWAVVSGLDGLGGLANLWDGFSPMAPVVRDFASIDAVDRDLLRRMARAMLPRQSVDPDLLDEAETRVPGIQTNGVYLALKARREEGRDRVLAQGEALLALAHRWPHDPLGWVNLMDLCCAQGQWESARLCAQKAPAGAAFFRIFSSLMQQVAAEDRCASQAFPTEPFYGQSDLGGIMMDSPVTHQNQPTKA